MAASANLPSLLINGDIKHPFHHKLNIFLEWMKQEIPALEGLTFHVETTNSFPHSTGIASSASGISAFTLCLLEIASQLTDVRLSTEELLALASYASRVGSGSACRSLYGGFTIWGASSLVAGSSDHFALPVNDMVHPDLADLRDAILVVSSKPKSIASSYGHQLMKEHPYERCRITQAGNNFSQAMLALQSGDLDLLGKISENEALSLHSLIMTSPGGDILFEPGSIAVIKKVKQFRSGGLPIFFTLDAGPNVHLLYPNNAKVQVENFIRQELMPLCEEGTIIFDHRGSGPLRLSQSSR